MFTNGAKSFTVAAGTLHPLHMFTGSTVKVPGATP
jgi:hypothetical protein